MLKISHAAVSVRVIAVCLLFSRSLGCSFIHSVVWAVQLPVCFQCIAESLILFLFISFYFTFDYTPNPPPFILFYIYIYFFIIFFVLFPRTPTAPYTLTKILFISFYFTFDYTPNPPPFILFYIYIYFFIIFFRFVPENSYGPLHPYKKKEWAYYAENLSCGCFRPCHCCLSVV